MITHHREWRPETRQAWWDALKEGDQWATDNGWLVSSTWGHLPILYGEGNWSRGYLTVTAVEPEQVAKES